MTKQEYDAEVYRLEVIIDEHRRHMNIVKLKLEALKEKQALDK